MATQSELITETPTTALATIEQFTPIELFRDGKLRSIVDRIKAEVRAVDTDISTEAGRKAIASLAYKVSRSKTFIDEQRVKLVADEKKRLKAIDDEGRSVREELDALRDEVRKPLTDWEEAEKDRLRGHEDGIRRMQMLVGEYQTLAGIEQARSTLDQLFNRNFQEFTKRASAAREDVALFLQREEVRIGRQEADRIERERIAAEAAEKARIEREAKIAEEAQLKAEAEAKRRADAEALAAKQREDELIRAAAEEKARLEREKKEAEERHQKAIDAANAQAQREKLAAEERERKAERDRKEAEAKAERDRALAVEAERKKIADEQAKRDSEAAIKRSEDKKARKDKEHRAAVHREILSDIGMALHGTPDGDSELLRRVIAAIAKGQVRHVSIQY